MKHKPDGTDCPPDPAEKGDRQLEPGVYGVGPRLAKLRAAAEVRKGPRTPAPLVGPKAKLITQGGLDVMLWPTVRGWLKKAGNARAKTEWDAHRDPRRLLVSLVLVAKWRSHHNDAKHFREYIETTAPAMTDLIPTLRKRLKRIAGSLPLGSMEYHDATRNYTETSPTAEDVKTRRLGSLGALNAAKKSPTTAAATKTRAANRAACRDLPPFLPAKPKKGDSP